MKNNLNGFTKSNNTIMQQIFERTDATCYAVYMAILAHRNSQTNECFPSRQRIMELTKLSEKTIKRKINELFEAGFIKINSGKQGTANNYYFPLEDFYKEWQMNDKQLMAARRKKAFKTTTKKDSTETLPEPQKEETFDSYNDNPFEDDDDTKQLYMSDYVPVFDYSQNPFE